MRPVWPRGKCNSKIENYMTTTQINKRSSDVFTQHPCNKQLQTYFWYFKHFLSEEMKKWPAAYSNWTGIGQCQKIHIGILSGCHGILEVLIELPSTIISSYCLYKSDDFSSPAVDFIHHLSVLHRYLQVLLCSTFWSAHWMPSRGWSTGSWRPGSPPRGCSASCSLKNLTGASTTTSSAMSLLMTVHQQKLAVASPLQRRMGVAAVMVLTLPNPAVIAELIVALRVVRMGAVAMGTLCGLEMAVSRGGGRVVGRFMITVPVKPDKGMMLVKLVGLAKLGRLVHLISGDSWRSLLPACWWTWTWVSSPYVTSSFYTDITDWIMSGCMSWIYHVIRSTAAISLLHLV